MFKNSYQSGIAVELFTPSDKKKIWKVTGKTLPKEYEKAVKSFVLNLEGSNIKLVIPGNERE
jgi:hypothetical protein